jgi:hypothetical protein
VNPALSLIIPAHNAAATLGDSLASVLAQTRGDWEAIVVDDASTDGTPGVAEQNKNARVRLISSPRRGPAAARNAGLAVALGGSVTFLDADDVVAPRFVEKMLAAMNSCDAVACGYELIGARLEGLGWAVLPGAADMSVQGLLLGSGAVITNAVRLDALRRCAPGGFDESLGVLEDWDLWLRAAAGGLRWAAPVDEPLFRYRLHDGLSSRVEQMWRTGPRVIGRACAGGEVKARAERLWTLRCCARALAQGEAALAAVMLESEEPLGRGDVEALAGAIVPAFQRAQATGPGRIAERLAEWRGRAAMLVSGRPYAAELLGAIESCAADWRTLAVQLIRELAPSEVPVVYGMGRNGRALVCELGQHWSGPIYWMDDDADARVPDSIRLRAHRMTPSGLTRRHAVIVTPNASGAIVDGLRAMGVRLLWPRGAARGAA